jgi:hypothetical protein
MNEMDSINILIIVQNRWNGELFYLRKTKDRQYYSEQ